MSQSSCGGPGWSLCFIATRSDGYFLISVCCSGPRCHVSCVLQFLCLKVSASSLDIVLCCSGWRIFHVSNHPGHFCMMLLTCSSYSPKQSCAFFFYHRMFICEQLLVVLSSRSYSYLVKQISLSVIFLYL